MVFIFILFFFNTAGSRFKEGMTDAGLQYGSVVNYASITIKSPLTKLPSYPPSNQFNKDLNSSQFKHSNKFRFPSPPLCLFEEWEITSHWNRPRHHFIHLLLLTRLHIEFKWVKEKEQWFHTSMIREKWRWAPIPRHNARSYTWLQKLTRVLTEQK